MRILFRRPIQGLVLWCLNVLSFVICDGTGSSNISDVAKWDVKLEKYHSHEDLVLSLQQLEKDFPSIAKTGSIGQSVEGRDLMYVRITSNATAPRPVGRPMFKYVGNMHGNEVIGREMLIAFAEYMVHNYGKDENVTRLVDSTDMYILPSLNPDGFHRAKVLDVLSKLKISLNVFFCRRVNVKALAERMQRMLT